MRTPFHLAAAALAVGVAAGSGTATAGMFDFSLLAMLRDCDERIRPGSEAFGVGLLAAVSEDGTRNPLVSPLGIGFVLEMMVPGAELSFRRSLPEMLDMGGGSPGQNGTDGTSSGGDDTLPPGSDDAAPADGSAAGGPAAGGSHGDDPDGNEESVGLTICRHVRMLHDASDDEAVKIRIASGAFADRRLDLFPAYSGMLRAVFDARVERLDFKYERASLGRINAWVEEETEGAIPHLVSSLGDPHNFNLPNPHNVLVLANTMRFEGEWAQRFDTERTVPAPFHLRFGTVREVPTMRADDLPARYREGEDFQAVAFPYGSGRFEFVAVLPRSGLEAAEALRRLAADPSWLGGQGFRKARGTLAFPRLALNAEASLLPALRGLGLRGDPLGIAALVPDEGWSLEVPAPDLSQVLHRTMLVLDERGTEAVAATAATMREQHLVTGRVETVPVEERTFEMRVDRPFALAVRHRDTGAVLFTAWVDDPAAAGER